MDRFSAIVTRMDDAIWSMLLVALCLGVGLFLSSVSYTHLTLPTT